MDDIENRKLVGRLVMSVLTEKRNVRETIKLFPKTKDSSIECAYHALIHYEADENMRYKDIEYREAQNDYLEMLAETLMSGKSLPKNIIEEYKPYYNGTAQVWAKNFKGKFEEFIRSICSF